MDSTEFNNFILKKLFLFNFMKTKINAREIEYKLNIMIVV